ncbi:MAG: ectonucleotide pyrophosphatase/phosphodiesterase [Rhodothermales bacterium]
MEPTVILISLDGFRWDYLDRYVAPTLDSLASRGVRAERLIPVFPTKTFPNHYSIVTGLYAENHGIISNTMYDPEMKARFSMSNQDAVTDARWWGGEPLWVTAEKQGLTAATYFWPGSEAPIMGMKATYAVPYEGRIPGNDRVDHVLGWLDLPSPLRPRFITLYFSDTDNAGHEHGPDAPEVAEAVTRVDGYLRRLVNGLRSRGLLNQINLVIVSDHGMAETSPERVIIIDDYFNANDAHIVDYSPVLMAYPLEGETEEAQERLDAHPHVEAFLKEDLPERLHLDHPRTPSLIAIVDEGWEFTTRQRFDEDPDRFHGGAHGYDNLAPSMAATFIAHGPAFRDGHVVEALDVVDIYNIVCEILDLDPAPNDGNADAVNDVLRGEAVQR